MQLQLGGNQQGLVGIISVLSKQLVPKSYESLAVSSTAVALPDIPEDAMVAHITVETNKTLRYTTTSDVPTASVGHLLSNGAVLELVGAQNIVNFKIIETEASTSSIKITYYI